MARMMTFRAFLAIGCFIISTTTKVASAAETDLIYGYECQSSKCVKVELSQENFEKAISLPVCRMFCGDDIGTVWPKPTGEVRIDQFMKHIDFKGIEFHLPRQNERMSQMWDVTKQRFLNLIDNKVPDAKTVKAGGHPMKIVVLLPTVLKDALPKLTLDTDESYKLTIGADANDETMVSSVISANSYFGARHGLETLAQLIVYDDIRREVQILGKVTIEDAPIYKWRGLLLDTARNFFSVKAIKRTLDAMAMVKLNTMHWHITDSQSFPMEIKSQPHLYKLGAYSPRKVYSHDDIAEIVQYGKIRGIRVMPEFDAPAHVGEGWQHTNMTVCFNAQPWKNFCAGPPCGQLNPTVDALYPVLEDIYREMFDLFDPDIFHMGGDEVSVSCWNSSQAIQNWMKDKGWSLEERDFIRLWGYFQNQALSRVDSVSKDTKVPITLWTSTLTDVPYIDEFLDKDRYIIQIWTTGSDPKVQEILKRGFRMIVSNYDALYLDCGFAAWVTDGNNWCSPYIGWQKVYDNVLEKIGGDYSSLIIGAEAAVWSEEIDEYTLDSRAWPRASALAERLWSNPKTDWRAAEPRMMVHREYLAEHGIGAEALQPNWCLQNEDQCPIDAYS